MAENLLLLFGNKRLEQATTLYNEAAECVPAEAVEQFDIQRAREALE